MSANNTPPLTPEQLEQLAQLKDIRLPEAISWWPPAPGWWLLLGVVLGVFMAVLGWRFQHRRRVKVAALHALANVADNDSSALAAELSALIRRVAIQQYGETVATLSGQQWADFLTQHQVMDRHIAAYLAYAPYAAKPMQAPVAAQTLIAATEQWLHRHCR